MYRLLLLLLLAVCYAIPNNLTHNNENINKMILSDNSKANNNTVINHLVEKVRHKNNQRNEKKTKKVNRRNTRHNSSHKMDKFVKSKKNKRRTRKRRNKMKTANDSPDNLTRFAQHLDTDKNKMNIKNKDMPVSRPVVGVASIRRWDNERKIKMSIVINDKNKLKRRKLGQGFLPDKLIPFGKRLFNMNWNRGGERVDRHFRPPIKGAMKMPGQKLPSGKKNAGTAGKPPIGSPAAHPGKAVPPFKYDNTAAVKLARALKKASKRPLVKRTKRFILQNQKVNQPRVVSKSDLSKSIDHRCPQGCNRRGKCLIDPMSPMKVYGLYKEYQYKCHCHPEWTGETCGTKVDMLIQWYESKGRTQFPPCCNVCQKQFATPMNYYDIPIYMQPYALRDEGCDAASSLDSRPDGATPCWRPLQYDENDVLNTKKSSLLEQLSSSLNNKKNNNNENIDITSSLASFLEEHDVRTQRVDDADARFQRVGYVDQILRRAADEGYTHSKKKDAFPKHEPSYPWRCQNTKFCPEREGAKLKAAAKHAAKVEQLARLRYRGIKPCCVYCNFDFWTQANFHPHWLHPHAYGMYNQRQMDRQQVRYRMGTGSIIREDKRNILLKQEKDAADRQSARENRNWMERYMAFKPTQSSFIETQDKMREALRSELGKWMHRTDGKFPWERDIYQEWPYKKRKRSITRDNAPPEDAGRKGCCTVCPVPVLSPLFSQQDAAKDSPLAPKNEPRTQLNYRLKKEKEVLRDFTNLFNGKPLGSRLLPRTTRKQMSKPCCNHCPSQFWIRFPRQDNLGPFAGEPIYPFKKEHKYLKEKPPGYQDVDFSKVGKESEARKKENPDDQLFG